MIEDFDAGFDRPDLAFANSRLQIQEHLFTARVIDLAELFDLKCRLASDGSAKMPCDKPDAKSGIRQET